MTIQWKTSLAALALASTSLVASCGEAEDDTTATGTQDEGTLTLAAALGTQDNLEFLQQAMDRSDLSAVFEGPASYTVLAPDDDAFEALGEDGASLLETDQRPILVAILRDHLLPGHLTPETIAEAIDKKGGPVTMTTLGETDVTFSKTGDTVDVTVGDGGSARFAGTAIAANNGVVIPIDTVLLPPKG